MCICESSVCLLYMKAKWWHLITLIMELNMFAYFCVDAENRLGSDKNSSSTLNHSAISLAYKVLFPCSFSLIENRFFLTYYILIIIFTPPTSSIFSPLLLSGGSTPFFLSLEDKQASKG